MNKTLVIISLLLTLSGCSTIDSKSLSIFGKSVSYVSTVVSSAPLIKEFSIEYVKQTKEAYKKELNASK